MGVLNLHGKRAPSQKVNLGKGGELDASSGLAERGTI